MVSRLSPHVPPKVLEVKKSPHESRMVSSYSIPVVGDISDFATAVRALEGCPHGRFDWVRCFMQNDRVHVK